MLVTILNKNSDFYDIDLTLCDGECTPLEKTNANLWWIISKITITLFIYIFIFLLLIISSASYFRRFFNGWNIRILYDQKEIKVTPLLNK